MNRPSLIVTNFLVFFLILLWGGAMQTSLLHWLLGWKASVQFVLVIVTYICLYRETPEAFIFTLLSFYALALISNILQSLSVFCGMVIFVALRTVKTRVYSSNPVHFTWSALGTVLGFHLLSWITASVFEGNAPPPMPLNWALEILMTALFTRMLYSFFIWLDKRTKRITISELNS